MVIAIGHDIYHDVSSVQVTESYVHLHYPPDPTTHVPPKSKMIDWHGEMITVVP